MQLLGNSFMRSTTLVRDEYGALEYTFGVTEMDDARMLRDAMRLVAQAAEQGLLPKAYDQAEYDRYGRVKGEAVRYSIYDISVDGADVIVCVRTEKSERCYVQTLSETYYMVTLGDDDITVEQLSDEARIVRIAKACGFSIGGAIAILRGDVRPTQPAQTRMGYKIVERMADGTLVSVWDGSRWEVGKWRAQKATPNYQGGFFYYPNKYNALQAIEERKAFGDSTVTGNLVLMQCEVAGREYEFDDGKRCVTRLRVLDQVMEL